MGKTLLGGTMKSPFPGMDPYLEKSGIWNQVHHDLLNDIRRFLIPKLQPNYYVSVEQTTYLSIIPPDSIGRPDVIITTKKTNETGIVAPVLTMETATAQAVAVQAKIVELPRPEFIRHRYLSLKHLASSEVVTVIEVLSPTNKTSNQGRKEYNDKRMNIIGSFTNLVEIDLLRIGEPFPIYPMEDSHYRVVIFRSFRRPSAEAYFFGIRNIIPDIPIPLKRHEPETILPLNNILHNLYSERRYDLIINYNEPCQPPLNDEDSAWAKHYLEGQSLL